MERYVHLAFEVREKDRVIVQDGVDTVLDSIAIHGPMTHLTLFFESRRTLTAFEEGLKRIRFVDEIEHEKEIQKGLEHLRQVQERMDAREVKT